MNDRFKWIPQWHNPVFFPERLEEPFKHKKPACIFVGSMCDLFGEWVCEDWIKQVLMVCEQNPKHTFFFLTKNPKRYLQFYFPVNCWLGTTLTTKDDFGEKYAKLYPHLEPQKTFISIEPILGSFEDVYLVADMVIVGAMTGRNAVRPEKEWIDSIRAKNIYYKSNIRKLFPKLTNNK